MFGYYIEISNPNLAQAPDDYVRRQTLVGGERFITPEMKEYESRVLNAQDRIGEIESALFRQVCQHGRGLYRADTQDGARYRQHRRFRLACGGGIALWICAPDAG